VYTRIATLLSETINNTTNGHRLHDIRVVITIQSPSLDFLDLKTANHASSLPGECLRLSIGFFETFAYISLFSSATTLLHSSHERAIFPALLSLLVTSCMLRASKRAGARGSIASSLVRWTNGPQLIGHNHRRANAAVHSIY
jgi:hypothetical protein